LTSTSLRIVIDGSAYDIGREPRDWSERKPCLLGFGGRRFDLELNTGERVTTHNLIYRGPSEEEPDTARFLGGAGQTITPRGVTCWHHSKGERNG